VESAGGKAGTGCICSPYCENGITNPYNRANISEGEGLEGKEKHGVFPLISRKFPLPSKATLHLYTLSPSLA